MDATITNTGTSEYFIPGPDVSLAAGESRVLSGVSLNDLDSNVVLKGYVLAGVMTISIVDDTTDAVVANQGAVVDNALPVYAYANLPTGFEGRVVFCTNGRKTAEGPGAGTGVPAYFSAAAWHVFYDDSVLAI